MGERVFKVGDRVIAISEYEGNDDIVGVTGTVIEVRGTSLYSVAYDDYIGGHTCNGKCNDGHGWRTSARCLEFFIIPEPVITMSYDEVMA